MDVDGTLTDGKIYMGDEGEIFKAFDIKDGCGIKDILPKYNIVPVIITARNSHIVINRCKELGVTEVYQGVRDKLACLHSIIDNYSKTGENYTLSNVAYIGDDILDLKCMDPIKDAGGIIGCPSNAVKDLLSVCDYIAPHKGGEGAIRDFVEFLIKKDGEEISNISALEKRCQEAVCYISKLTGEELSLGRHNVNDYFFYKVLSYVPETNIETPYESHRKYIDIQMLLEGEEMLQVTDVNRLKVSTPYDVEKDCVFYSASENASGTLFRPGSVVILFPKDAHRSIGISEKSIQVKKIVGKILIK